MNILIFSWRDPKHPHAGGAEVATMEHAKRWSKEGNSVTWFASTFTDAPPEEILDNIKIVRQGNQLGSVHAKAALWYWKLKVKPDLIVDQFHGIPFYAPLIAPKKKILGYIHEVAKEVWFDNHLKFPLNYLYGFVGRIIEPITFLLFYRNIPFMSVSNSTKNDLKNYQIPEKNIHIIHNGVTLLKSSAKKEKKKTVIFLGALAKDKGIYDALECFAKINRDEDEYRYWVVGKSSPDFLKELKKYSKKLGLSDKITFWGYVSQKKKFELLTRAHVMVNPSEHEGWGLVNIEANSCGTPVVAYNVHGIRDSVKNDETGILVSPKAGSAALATSCIELLNNKDKLSKMSRRCIQWSEKFTWEKSTKESLNLVNEIVAFKNS